MKNCIPFLLSVLIYSSFFAMDQSSVIDVSTVKPAELMIVAGQAFKAKNVPRAATCVALKKIFTRMDSACIPAHFDHEQHNSIEIFRNSDDFMQQTGPVYHHTDPQELQEIIQAPTFKPLFAQQVTLVAVELANKTLPTPEWIFSHNSFKTCGTSSDDLVPEQEWFSLRLTALKTYHQDQELFPAGPSQIIIQQPKPIRSTNRGCTLL